MSGRNVLTSETRRQAFQTPPGSERYSVVLEAVRAITPQILEAMPFYLFFVLFLFLVFFSRGLYSGTNPAAKERPVSLSELGLLESSPQAIRCSVPIIVKQLRAKAVISEIPVKSIAVYWVVSPT